MEMRILALLLVLTWGAAGCGGGEPVDTGVPEAVGDTELVKEAQAAVNAIIRSAADCAAVEASYADVIAKLDDVEGRVQTQAGRSTMATLRKQVDNVAEPCGVR